MDGPSDERALASVLAASEDDALCDLFAARRLPPATPADDFFDVAAALLSEPSIDRALARLSAPMIAALVHADASAVAPPVRDALHALALVDADGVPYRAVNERLTASGIARFASDADEPATGSADAAGTASSAERAFSATASLADVVVAAMSAPLHRTGAGAVSAVERKRLVDEGAVADGDALDDILALGEDAGLLRPLDRSWVTTDLASAWLDASTADRWRTVALAYIRSLPSALRTADGGFIRVPSWAGRYPLDAEWPARAAVLARRAQSWGILTADGTQPPWTSVLLRDGLADTSTLTEHLPPEVDRIYLQADLSAISPGPLAPRLEQRLRRMTVREARAQASTYRFSADSLTAAVSGGETAASIREFLETLSLTGIPQPLAYLIDTTAARHGLIRVGTDAAGRTVVRSDDPQTRATLAVDHALRPVGLVAHDDTLVSRASRDTVYWSLVDARYPVVAVDADDQVERVSRRTAGGAAVSTEPTQQYAALIARLRSTHGPDADAAWLERELEQAVRGRSVVEVDVSLPDGTTRTFILEATGLGGGRLRGLDRAADVERTLPLTSIAAVRPR
ncbi:helicase-associated domain-containing protein [Microbacterium sp. NPDC089189]|uniref:helicase-associated domain-containing protein n=1 Tax=Microbacterium sp. NPDC089189 TaxID=3154972 RepID=UPI0034299CD7